MKIDDIPNINYFWSQLIVEELIRNGVKRFCISPGSRSTPLTLAAAACESALKVVHFDERGLGYFALGEASFRNEPVVLISTSGTAVANFFPAVVEASKKKIPLILLTADRPPELRKTGALQTIDQPGIFGKYVRWEFDLPVPDEHIKPEMVLTTVDQAVFMSKYPLPGPVHINCPFREPLAPEQIEGHWKRALSLDRKWMEGSDPLTIYLGSDENFVDERSARITEILNSSRNGLIVAGKLRRGEEKYVLDLADRLNWPVFPDLSSGLRLEKGRGKTTHYYDQVLLSDILNEKKIDTVLHLGGRLTSRRFYQFIEKIKPENYVTVIDHPLRNDPLHIVTHRIKSSVSGFVHSVIAGIKKKEDAGISAMMRSASAISGRLIEEFIEKKKHISEIFIAREISARIESGSFLFLSNSMPVRDMDMYAVPADQKIRISGNRGASGIDGIIASAAGYAFASQLPGTLVIGDIAFLHDINSLDLIRTNKIKLIIVLINNNGGSIFSFLPISQYPQWFEHYFTTPHGLSFKSAAELFGLNYARITSKEKFVENYRSAAVEEKSTILEVVVDSRKNVQDHEELQSLIKNELNNKYLERG